MAKYVDSSLGEHERIVLRGRWPMVFWLGAWLALIFLGVFLVGIWIFVHSAVVMSTTEFAVTNHRVILKRGLLNRDTRELAVASVETVQLHQSLLGRIFNYGSLAVTGTGDTIIIFPPMADPVAFRRAIESTREVRTPSDRPA
jgi:uncharacterized membrane protein YdbT with pleckstrin-like domain